MRPAVCHAGLSATTRAIALIGGPPGAQRVGCSQCLRYYRQVTPCQVAGKASIFLALLGCGCFVVIGDLPEPRDRESGSGGAGGSSGKGGGGGSTASGGTGAGAGGAGTGGTSSSSGGAGGSGGSGGTSSSCDRDGDQALAVGACGGDDCDDNDPLVKPGQTTFFASESPTVGWDWNCSGQIERESEQLNPCSLQLLGLSCTDRPEGWLSNDPLPCGTTARWGKCKLGPLGATCVEDVLDQNKVVKCH